MSILVGRSVGKSFGAFDVFLDLNFSVAKGDKIALVGANGCGKTTLLRVVAGEDEPNIGGGVTYARGVTKGYLSQTAEDSDEHTVWQACQSAFDELHLLQEKLSQIEHALSQNGSSDKLLEKYGALQHEFELKGGYEIEQKIKRVLGGLGFSEDHWHKPLSQLSGGQRVRAALAQLLLQSPDVLLLDEPTNHLDRQGIEWLEGFLQEWEGTLIVVSHDRYFLDEVCEQVWEMGKRADGLSYLDFYRGGYTDYARQRTERRERAQIEFEAQQEFIQKQEDYIRRNIAGQNTLQAKGRLKRLNRMERLERPNERRAMSLRLNSDNRSGDRVLETHRLVIGYADESSQHRLFGCPNLLLLRAERAALIGPNGTGKTTFLKTVMGEIEPLSGEAKLGAAVKVGYFAQAHEGLDPDNTVLQELMDAKPDIGLKEARNILGRFLFSGDDQFKKIEMLSGGERGRVALAKLTLQGANFLLLDEPTNHLDIPSQEIITEALNHFDGTLLFVSHDRYLIAALATQLWILDRDANGETALNVFKGTYDAWVEQNLGVRSEELGERTQNTEARSQRADERRTTNDERQTINVQTNKQTSKQLSKNAQMQRVAKLEAAENRIAELEKQLNELSWQMESVGNDFVKLQTLSDNYKKTEEALEQAWSAFENL
jgi:ATP-binding cassette subfamily F protein 3